MNNLGSSSEQEMLIDLADRFDIGEIVSVSYPTKGVSFQNSVIVTSKGAYVLRRIKRVKVNLARVSFVQSLFRKGFPTMEFMSDRDGSVYFETDDEYILMSKFIEGDHPEVNEDSIVKMAKLLADFHEISQGDLLPEDGQSGMIPGYLQKLIEKVDDNFREIAGVYGSSFKTNYDLMKMFVERPSHLGCQKGIVHNDFKPDNILVDKNGKYHLIDMFDLKYLELIADVARFIIKSFCPDQEFSQFQRNTDLFLKEYLAKRPKMRNDLWAVKDWMKHIEATGFFFYLSSYNDDRISFDKITKAKQRVGNINLVDRLEVDC